MRKLPSSTWRRDSCHRASEISGAVQTANEIAQEYSVHSVQVGQWKKVILEGAKTLFQSQRGPKVVDEHSDVERLYGEVGRLKMELDWLKKSRGSAACEAVRLG